MGRQFPALCRAVGALAWLGRGVVYRGQERQTHLQAPPLAPWQGLQHMGDAAVDGLHLRQPDNQRPAQLLGEQERQHPRTFTGFGLAAGEHHLGAGLAQIFAEHRQGIAARRLFEHMQLGQAHAQVTAQGRFGNVAGVQHLQLIPRHLQAQFDRARILFGAARAAGGGVGADGHQADYIRGHGHFLKPHRAWRRCGMCEPHRSRPAESPRCRRSPTGRHA